MASYVSAFYEEPTSAAEDLTTFWRYVEYQGRLYKIFSDDYSQWPNLCHFDVQDAAVEEVHVSVELEELLKTTIPFGYGANAFVRLTRSKPQTIVKCAFPYPSSRAQLKNEHQMYELISGLHLPAPHMLGPALQDADGVLGITLEKLEKGKESDKARRVDVAQTLLHHFHEQGIVHNDLRPDNVMTRADGTNVLIDFGCSGLHGEPIPPFLRHSSATSGIDIFEKKTDLEALQADF